MLDLFRTLGRFARDQKGLETVEYAVMAALLTSAAILAISGLGAKVAADFQFFVSVLG